MVDLSFREWLSLLLVVVSTVLIILGYPEIGAPVLVGISIFYFGGRIVKRFNGKKEL